MIARDLEWKRARKIWEEWGLSKLASSTPSVLLSFPRLKAGAKNFKRSLKFETVLILNLAQL
jgi:hypothetical protein